MHINITHGSCIPCHSGRGHPLTGKLRMNETQANTRCVHCGHEWTYGGSNDMTTCPNCQYKTNVDNINHE